MFLSSFYNNHELKIFLDIADTNAESSKLIQPDVIGASLVVPPLQIESSEKVQYLLNYPFCYELTQTS